MNFVVPSPRETEPYNKVIYRFSQELKTELEPVIQSKLSMWSVVNLKKQLTSMNSKLESTIWSHDTGHIGVRGGVYA